MQKTGISKLVFKGYTYGSVAELENAEERDFIVPDSISLELDGEPLRYTQVDAHGNPQISGVAHSMTIWKIRQMVRDGKIDSQYSAKAKYSYETTPVLIEYPISKRLPRPEICPVCGKPITVEQLDGFIITRESTAGGDVCISSESRIDTIGQNSIVVHEPCGKVYRRLQMIDEITETVRLAFNCYDIDEKNRFHWGKGPHNMWYELIPNEYCSRSCCEHRPWFLFHTPIGDIKIGWRKRVINITFMANFVDFSMDIFHKEDVTKYVENGERTIHAWSKDKMYDYLCIVQRTVLPNEET